MANRKFTPPPGLSWDVKRKPSFSTAIQASGVPGSEVRVAYSTQPQWEITCAFEFLRDKDPNEDGLTELTKVLGFFLQRGGAFDSFWLDLSDFTQNDADAIVTGAALGTGNGAATAFQVARNYGGFTEECYAPQVANVYDNGDPVDPAGYTVVNGFVVFTVAPVAGHILTVDYTHLYLVRFAKDEAEFSNFQFELYELQEIGFLTVRP